MSALALAWQSIQAQLEHEKRRLHEEMREYPTPIPACDQQFNYLLEQRAGIAHELARLHQVCAESLRAANGYRLLDEFLHSTPYLDGETKRRITAALDRPGAGGTTVSI
jgi:hypothetical protein